MMSFPSHNKREGAKTKFATLIPLTQLKQAVNYSLQTPNSPLAVATEPLHTSKGGPDRFCPTTHPVMTTACVYVQSLAYRHTGFHKLQSSFSKGLHVIDTTVPDAQLSKFSCS